MKMKKLASDMAASLDRIYDFTCKIKELKLEATIKLHEDNRKLELEMFKFTQASQERMTNFFASVFQGLKKLLWECNNCMSPIAFCLYFYAI